MERSWTKTYKSQHSSRIKDSHTYTSSPNSVLHTTRKTKYSRGKTINYFSSGESYIERNIGSPHVVESVGNKTAVHFVNVSYANGLPTTINK